jgi:hypothetical protein
MENAATTLNDLERLQNELLAKRMALYDDNIIATKNVQHRADAFASCLIEQMNGYIQDNFDRPKAIGEMCNRLDESLLPQFIRVLLVTTEEIVQDELLMSGSDDIGKYDKEIEFITQIFKYVAADKKNIVKEQILEHAEIVCTASKLESLKKDMSSESYLTIQVPKCNANGNLGPTTPNCKQVRPK